MMMMMIGGNNNDDDDDCCKTISFEVSKAAIRVSGNCEPHEATKLASAALLLLLLAKSHPQAAAAAGEIAHSSCSAAYKFTPQAVTQSNLLCCFQIAPSSC